MNQIEMTAEVRTQTGKGVSRKLRAIGKVPAVVYGRGVDPTAITLDAKELTDFLKTGKANRTLIILKVEGRDDLGQTVMIFREIQRHHIKRNPLAADLMVIDKSRPINVSIPVLLRGTPDGEKLGGVLQHLARELEVIAIPDKIPDELEINVSEMQPGDTLYIEQVELPEDVTVNVKEKTPICTLTIPRGFEEDEEGEGEEGEEGVEGAEGEAEEKTAESEKE